MGATEVVVVGGGVIGAAVARLVGVSDDAYGQAAGAAEIEEMFEQQQLNNRESTQ